ncbi:MAG: leucyl aminopeptidase [Proteobacteria bacterium]|nr:leucyl aminopeptidase [Pseudomonadota bacterium]
MNITINTINIEQTKSDLLVLPLVATNLKEQLAKLDKLHQGQIQAAVSHFSFKAERNARMDVTLNSSKSKISFLRLSGVSSLDKVVVEEWRKLGGDAYSTAKRNKTKKVSLDLTQVSAKSLNEVLEAAVEGFVLSSYEFNKYFSKDKTKEVFAVNLELLVPASRKKAAQDSLKVAIISAKATSFARDIVNIAPSDLQPKDVVKFARTIKGSNISLKVFGKKELEKMGADCILGVSRGSDTEPFMLHFSYKPKTRSKNSKTITLIGKGITFDSGGLSIKPGKGMEDMKCDMAGAACVLSIMKAISELPAENRPKHEINVIVPTCENMINGKALKPGDVIKAINGKSIEVLNTDAEGRLILADALSYAEKLESDLIIDLATLTGACIVALGTDYSGLFSNNQKYTEQLLTHAEKAGEKMWQLPLAKEYRALMNSPIADIKNIGDGGPGAIIAALFLEEFVPKNTPWIHLDIAGPAFVTKTNEYIKKGGTGCGVLTLLRFLGEV